jgi:uncharacterized protein YoxC
VLLFVEISVVVASLAVVVIAVAAVRALSRVENAARELSTLTGQAQQWIGQADALTREAREGVADLRAAAVPLRRVAQRFEALGTRSADLSAAVLGEVAGPLHMALDVARGLRAGIACLSERRSHRSSQGRAATQERTDHE